MNQQHKYNLRKGPRPCSASEASPLKPGSINDSDEYEVESIVGRRIINGVVHYNVKWKGWPSEDNTWEPFLHCVSCIDSVIDFEEELKEDSIAGPSWHPKGNYCIPPQRILSPAVIKGLEYVRKCQDANTVSCTDNSNVKKTTRKKVICQNCKNVIPPCVNDTRRSLDVNPPQSIVISPTNDNVPRTADVNPPQSIVISPTNDNFPRPLDVNPPQSIVIPPTDHSPPRPLDVNPPHLIVIPPTVDNYPRPLDVNPPHLIVIPETVDNYPRPLDVNPPQLNTAPVNFSLDCFDETTQFVDMCEVGKTTANGRYQVREFTGSMQAMRTAIDLRSEVPSVCSGNSNIAYVRTSSSEFDNLEKLHDSTAIQYPFAENSRFIGSARTIMSTASGEKANNGGQNCSGHRAGGMAVVTNKKKQNPNSVKKANWRRNNRREKALQKQQGML